jgi:hypothetical protein
METTTSSDDARTTCALRLVVVGVALLFAEEEVDFTDIKPEEERSDLEEVIVKLMINGKSKLCCLLFISGSVFLDL